MKDKQEYFNQLMDMIHNMSKIQNPLLLAAEFPKFTTFIETIQMEAFNEGIQQGFAKGKTEWIKETTN